MNDDLMREVDQAMQQERMQQLWKRYGKQVITGIAVIVSLSAGAIFWEKHQQSTRYERTAMLLRGQDIFTAQEYSKARDIFAEVAEGAKGDTGLLASLWLAKSEMALGNVEGARRIAQAIDAGYPAGNLALKHYACLMQVMLPPNSDGNGEVACLASISPEDPFFRIAQEMRIAQAVNSVQPIDGLIPALDDASLSPTQQQRIEDYKAYSESGVAGASQ